MNSCHIVLRLTPRGKARRDDPNNIAIASVAMAHQDESSFDAYAKQNKSVLAGWMIRIGNELSVYIEKNRVRLHEADTVLWFIEWSFIDIPLKAHTTCSYSVVHLI